MASTNWFSKAIRSSWTCRLVRAGISALAIALPAGVLLGWPTPLRGDAAARALALAVAGCAARLTPLLFQVQRIGAGIFALRLARGRLDDVKQIRKIAGVFFFIGEDFFHHMPGGGVVVGKKTDHLLVALDDDALGDQVFLDHLGERLTFHILCD